MRQESIIGTYSTAVFKSSVFGQERQINNFAVVESTRCGGESDRVGVRARTASLVVTATTVVCGSRTGGVIIWVTVKSYDIIIGRATGSSGAGQGGGDGGECESHDVGDGGGEGGDIEDAADLDGRKERAGVQERAGKAKGLNNCEKLGTSLRKKKKRPKSGPLRNHGMRRTANLGRLCGIHPPWLGKGKQQRNIAREL